MKKTTPLLLSAFLLITCNLKAQNLTGTVEITGGSLWTSNNWTKLMKLPSGGAIQLSAGGHHFGIGTATNPNSLYFFTSSTENTDAPAQYRMVINQYGSVGIGTATPQAQLDVQGSFRLGTGGSVGGEAYCIGFTRDGNAHLYGTKPQGLLLGGDATGSDMAILPNGNIGIGTSNPQAKLAVNGNIFAKKIKVTINALDWPDHVFLPGYRLRSLPEVERFIHQNGHLPDIPSATEIGKAGLDLGDMNKNLLQKIEELTLHLIELDKQNKQMQAEIKQLNERLPSGKCN